MLSKPQAVTPSRVVIVEDDRDTLELYSLFLSTAGYAVHQARNGADGLELVRSVQPSVVVTDLTLPDLGGGPLCKALRKAGSPGLQGLIVVSGSADEDVLATARAAGADDILTKPCLPAELEAAIRRVLNAGDASVR